MAPLINTFRRCYCEANAKTAYLVCRVSCRDTVIGRKPARRWILTRSCLDFLDIKRCFKYKIEEEERNERVCGSLTGRHACFSRSRSLTRGATLWLSRRRASPGTPSISTIARNATRDPPLLRAHATKNSCRDINRKSRPSLLSRAARARTRNTVANIFCILPAA